MPIWVWIVIGILVVLVLFVISTYNRLVVLRNKVKEQWAQIDVQLKRRFDLIPNLVETVKGYAKHESETLEGVIQARNRFLSAKTPEEEMAADEELTKVMNRLFALTESYPDLKANTNFLDLQQELKFTEEHIATNRSYYNTTVLAYNNKIEMIPSNLVALLFHFKKEALFQANEAERENVQVKF